MSWAPDRGDLVWLDFHPQAGREQAGRRPALTISPSSYNSRVGLALVCPVTTKVKGYPFEIELPPDAGISGVVLSDQIKSLDWRRRNAELAARIGPEIVEQVVRKILFLVE